MDFSDYHVIRQDVTGFLSAVRESGPYTVPDGFTELFGAERDAVLRELFSTDPIHPPTEP